MSPTLRADLWTRRFAGRLTKETFAAFGVLAAVAGLLDILFPNLFGRAPGAVLAAVIVLCVGWGVWRAWPRPIEHSYTTPNTTIRVVRGSLFDQPGHLVIGTCDTFDTEPPSIIELESVQGQALTRFFGSDVSRLDVALASALSQTAPVGEIQKAGKTKRYAIGTVAALDHDDRKLFWLAYTEMNEHNEAQGSVDGVWKSLVSLWSAASRHGNGKRISIPVIGGGQSRLSQILPAQDSIRLIALSFMFASRSAGRFCDELC